MEDIKKIQEFFSKPLNEEKEPLDIIDFAKVVKAVQQTGHPVTVLLVPKFNEIEVITGMNAPDDMLFDLSNAVDALGYSRNDIIIAGDSSNLSRREYSDIRRVNGGAKDYFEESVKENSRRSPDFILTEPAEIKYTESFGSGIKAPGVLHHANEGVFLGAEGAYIIVLPGGTFYVDEDKEEAIPIYPLKDQSRELQLALDYTPFSPKFETWKSWIKRPKTLDEGAEDIMDAYNDVLDLVKNHSRRLSDDDSYAFGLKLKSWFNKNILDEATKDEENEFHKKLDTLVHDTFGKRKGELEEGASTEEKRMAMQAIKRFAKYRGVSEKEAKADLIRAVKELGSIEEAINEIVETIQAGKVLEEKLCKKGEAYRKRRMAAGEKSSAYLSGRAVKVCKGQISGRKKRKKRKSKK